MAWLATQISEAAPKVFAAVTTEIGAYFRRQRLFQVQFLFPTLAFLVGCLGILVVITGPDLYLVWWPELPLGLKGALGALLVVLCLLFLQASSSLLVLVRNLYSQGWPRLGPWQQFLRMPFLKARLAQEREVRALQRAWSDLNNARKTLEELLDTAGPAPGTPAPTAARYPVPRASVSAYQVILGDDWEWAELPVDKGDPILEPALLVGRYALRSLEAGRPVAKDAVRTPHDLGYLDQATRRLLALSVFRAETGPELGAGTLVTLWLTPRDGSGPVAFDDLLVLDRPTPGEIVLSVPLPQVEALLALLPTSQTTFMRSLEPPERKRVAVPVANSAAGLKPGQLITLEEIRWRTPKPGEDLDGVPVSTAEIADHVYWPSAAGLVCFPLAPESALADDALFVSSQLAQVERPEWLKYQDPGGRCKSRLAYCLPLKGSDSRPEVQWRDTEGATTNLLATASLPIRGGDRVTVELDGKPDQRWCYVYEVDETSHLIYIAVEEREAFDKRVQAAHRIALSPLCELPVLVESRGQGQLVRSSQVKLVAFRAAGVPGDVCLSPDEVEEHYVRSGTPPQLDRPIPRGCLGQTKPGNWTWLDLPKGWKAVRPPADEPDEPVEKPARGHLVSVEISVNAVGKAPDRVFWDQAFVRSSDPSTGALGVGVPKVQEPLARALLGQSEAQVAVAVTHSDARVARTLAEQEGAVQEAERLGPINRALSSVDPDEARLEEQSEELSALAGKLKALLAALAVRPWQQDLKDEEAQDPAKLRFRTAAGERARRLVWRLEDAVGMWLDAVDRLRSKRQLAIEAGLPDNLAETCPTELGNVLAAAADHAQTAYQIDAASTLPRLIHALDEQDSEVARLTNAEESMNTLLLFSFWSAVWAVLGAAALLAFRGPMWAFPVVLAGGAALSWVAKEAAVARAYAYGDALKALFDLKRRALLESMGFDLPEKMTPADEAVYWHNLTRLFAYGEATEDFPPTKVKAG